MSFDSDAGYVPDTPNFAIFFLLCAGATPADWVRLWSGAGDYAFPADAFDTSGGTYIGLGFPLGIPAISQAFNGSASSLEFSLSGVDATALRAAGVDRETVNMSLLYVGLIDLDEHQQPVGTCDWLTEAQAGMPRTQRVGNGSGSVMSVTLPASLDFFDRNLAATNFWSDASQKLRSATDTMFAFIARMNLGMVISWPA